MLAGETTNTGTVNMELGALETVLIYNDQPPSATGARFTFAPAFVDPNNPGITVLELQSLFCPGRCDRVTNAGIVPGDYTLALFFEQSLSGDPLLPLVPVTVEAEPTTTHTFDVSGVVGVLTGTITINGQPPEFGVFLCLGPSGANSHCFELSADGSFSGLLPAGPGTGEARTFDTGSLIGTFSFEVLAGETVTLGEPLGNTQPGSDVVVAPFNPNGTTASDVTLTFGMVTTAGNSFVTRSETGPPPPDGFRLGNPPVYYDITTTAVFSGPVTVCIDYSSVQFGNEENLQLSHREVDPTTSEEVWVDQTVSLDTANDIICAEVTSLSLFIVAERSVLDVTIDIKPGSDPNSINLGNKGGIPVAILTTDDFDAADVDPATVTLGNDDGNDTSVATRANGSLTASLEDVDNDGDLDLILHFDTQALVENGDLDENTTELILNGKTFGGQEIQDSDSVNIVPNQPPAPGRDPGPRARTRPASGGASGAANTAD